MWLNNNTVKSLSNFRSPVVIIPNEVQQQIKIDKVRQCKLVGVPVLLQLKDYSETFHLIEKGNGVEV